MNGNTRPKGHYTGPIALKWCDYSNTVRAMPANYLAADLSHIDASLWGREGEIGHLMAAAPAMLAALEQALAALETLGRMPDVQALVREAIAAATGQQSPDAIAKPDEPEPEGLATYRITETVVYLVKAEDEAHAERRFVCEAGIHADCFHAVEGRTFELVEDGEEFTCTACGRAEDDCSADPCEAVIEDRES